MVESTARSRHPDSIRQAFLWALIPTLVLFLIAPSVGDAQVTTSITSTTGAGNLGTTVTQVGNLYNITDGTRPGNGPNLFHSFGDFSVGAGDIGNFLNTPVNGSLPLTSNILSRVTGGNISNIYGTIQTTDFGNANLFLVNPSGIVFGPNGSVNVGGSVSFTTAQYLRLFDGVSSANFYANPASDGLANSILVVDPVANFGFLSSAAPGAYGFLTAPNPKATITVQGSELSVPPGPPGSPVNSISLVGGKVVIQGATLPDGTVQPARLSAPNGRIQLASAASPGEFAAPEGESLANATTLLAVPNNPVDAASAASFTSFGSVSLAPGSSINVSGASTVWIKGGQIVISVNDSVLTTLTTSQTPGRPETISLSPGSSLVTSNSGTDPSADIQLIASNVQMDGALQTSTLGAEGGGDIWLNAETLTLANGAQILSQTGDFSPGKLGHGGNVTIQGLQGAGFAAESVGLSGDSSLVSQTFGSGVGGQVTVAAKSVTLDGAFTTINSSTFSDGPGGEIMVGVQHLTLSGGATITSSNIGAPAALGGTITVQGLQEGSKADSLTLKGQASRMISETFSTALPGKIEVHAKAVNLTDGAVIQAGSLATLSGGNVTVDADLVGISGGSSISSQAFTTNAGVVTIKANMLILDNGSIITETRSAEGGQGGNVVLNVGTVSLTNGAKINSSTLNTGRAGDITMNVGSLTLANHSEITNSSTGIEIEAGAGDAGNITIHSGSTFVMNNSKVTTEASQASGGQIEITAPGMVRLTNSRISTSVLDGTGGGGNITIDPQFVILQNSQIIAQAFAGSGGAIGITAGVFLADPASVVDASSTLGISGTVNIQSPVQNLGEQLTPLSQQFSSAAALLAQRCAARVADGKFSTFVVAGREGLPVEPGGFLASPSLTSELLGSGLAGRDPHTQFPAVTGLFQEYDARPIQLAKFGNACR